MARCLDSAVAPTRKQLRAEIEITGALNGSDSKIGLLSFKRLPNLGRFVAAPERFDEDSEFKLHETAPIGPGGQNQAKEWKTEWL